jgi:selenide, water dikinase
MDQTPVKTDIVLVGGGHAHVEVLRRFGMRPEPGVRLTMISRETLTPYSGMLPGLIAGHYSHAEAHIDLAPLASFANARLYHDEVIGLDLLTRQIECRNRPPVRFDLLSIDTGSAPSRLVSGAEHRIVPVKPVSHFYAHWQKLRERVRTSNKPLSIGVVGAGAGGVELLMAVRHRLLQDVRERDASARTPILPLSFELITSSASILPSHNRRVRARYHAALAQANVRVTTAFEVATVSDTDINAADGRSIELDEVLWVTTAAAPAWPRESGLATDEAGFIRVDSCLQADAFPGVFAAGDIASVDTYPRPKSGVFAVRQGPPLAENLRRASRGQPLKPYHPQRHFLSLISTGDQFAVASRGPFALAGHWVWRWKDFIDRRFMERYADLPQMEADPHQADDDALLDTMRCGGCGSKIGAEILHEALTALAPPGREDVLIGLQQADDAAVVRVPAGHLAVHTVDAFKSFIDDPWMLGRVGAVHGLSDIYAMGATPQTALAIVTLPYGSTERMRDDLVQIMRGALDILNEANTILVGGHTGEGSELALGFAINGHVAEDQLVRKRGVHDGDAIILTQALGSGVLFAAAMRAQAKALWLDEALAAMSTSKAAAANCFAIHDVHAMTDVTGFGLVGHLHEMLDDHAQQGAELSISRLPIYLGAEELVAGDILSSLHSENRRAERFVTAASQIMLSPRYQLAFDPQTAGGLLATVPESQAQSCVASLRNLGYQDSVVIGHVRNGLNGIHLCE